MFSKIFFTSFLVLATLGHAEENSDHLYESAIIGGGVGGGAAAIYLARAGLHPIVIEKSISGSAITQSEAVENWPGAIKIRGVELIERIHKQAETNGAVFINGEVVSVDFSKRPFTIAIRTAEKPKELKTIHAQTCIIATGSRSSYLNVPGEKKYWGRGLSCCAICDGSLYRGKKVGVIGGGDAAILEGLYLANIVDEVTIFVRNDHLKANDVKKKEALLALPNVKVIYQTQIKEIKGDNETITGVAFTEQAGPLVEKQLDGVFLAIGSKPNTALFQNQLEMDDQGYIILKNGQQTSVEGVYAIGDVVDPLYKQAISAAGDGSKAALALIQSGLSKRGSETVSVAKAVVSPTSPKIIEITSARQFEEEIKSGDMPLIVDFYATWCSPCKRIAPKIESLASELAGKVKFLKVNIDTVNDLSKNYKIMSMPTVLYFDRKGMVIDRKVGEQEISELIARLSGSLQNQD